MTRSLASVFLCGSKVGGKQIIVLWHEPFEIYDGPCRFFPFWTEYRDKEFKLLDVGCGNHSPVRTKKWFPNCKYHGLDKCNYNNDDINAIDKYYEIDLTKSCLEELPDSVFDVVMFKQVIEHIPNGMEVIERLSDKVANGDVFYIDFPGVSSLSASSLCGPGLHFHSDSSHIAIYDTREIANILLKKGFKVLRGGLRRDWRRQLLFPILLIAKLPSLLWRGEITYSGLWSVCGHTQMIYARKKSE